MRKRRVDELMGKSGVQSGWSGAEWNGVEGLQCRFWCLSEWLVA